MRRRGIYFLAFFLGMLVIVGVQAWVENDPERGEQVERLLDRIYR